MNRCMLVMLLMAGSASCLQTVMPWLCLERCDNQTLPQISDNVRQINSLFHKGLVNRVSFERFNLGPNGTLVLNVGLTDVAPMMDAALDKFAMISSFPYPPEFLSWMRQVFADPLPFIEKVVVACGRYRYSGVNVDWEPTAKATPQDASSYAAFLSLMNREMNLHGYSIGVDFASWNAIWDWKALARADVNVTMMSTYTGNNTLWKKALGRAQSVFTNDNLVVGMQSIDPNTGGPLTQQQLDFRFSLLQSTQAKNIAIWRAPVPDTWIPYIKNFMSQ